MLTFLPFCFLFIWWEVSCLAGHFLPWALSSSLRGNLGRSSNPPHIPPIPPGPPTSPLLRFVCKHVLEGRRQTCTRNSALPWPLLFLRAGLFGERGLPHTTTASLSLPLTPNPKMPLSPSALRLQPLRLQPLLSRTGDGPHELADRQPRLVRCDSEPGPRASVFKAPPASPPGLDLVPRPGCPSRRWGEGGA